MSTYDDVITKLSFPQAVIEFNRQILKIEPREIGQMEKPEFAATLKAFIEETMEYEKAFENHDFIGQIDAIVDLIYFGYGALYKMGLNADKIERIQTAVHMANIQKKKGVVEKRGNPLGDAVKPEGWISPEERISKILGG